MVTCDAGLGLSGCCALPKLLMAMATTASRLLNADALHAAAGADNQLGWCSLWTFLLSAGIQGTTGTDTSTRLQAQYGWAVPKLLRGDLVGLPTPHELKLTGMIAASRSKCICVGHAAGRRPAGKPVVASALLAEHCHLLYATRGRPALPGPRGSFTRPDEPLAQE